MTDEGNVVHLDDIRKHKNPWRITGLKYMDKDDHGNPIQMMTVDPDGKQCVVRGIILHIQFLDREPSKLITVDGDKGHKGINVPIPLGMPADGLYAILRALPEQIQAHLDGRAPQTDDEPPPEAV